MRAVAQLVVLLVAIAAGCGSGTTPAPDAGPPLDAGTDGGRVLDAAPFAPSVPVDPAPPAPPVLTPCPTGWREVAPTSAGEVTVCDPWGPTGSLACADDEVQWPGGAACERIGTACPADGLPDGLPAGATVVYVLAGSPAGGDGSRASPYARIEDAVAAAPAGATVAIGIGTYDEVVTTVRAVTLRGACPSGTRIARSSASIDTGSVVVPTGADYDVAIENLSVGGEGRGVDVRGGTVRIDSVLVDRVLGRGLSGADATRIDARRLVVRGVREIPDDFRVSGVYVENLGDGLFLDHASIEGCTGDGLSATTNRHDGAPPPSPFAVHADDVVVRGTRGSMRGAGAIWAAGHLTVDLARMVLEDNACGAIVANGPALTLSDSVVRGTTACIDGTGGKGLLVRAGGHLRATRVLFDRNTEVAAMAREDAGDPGTSLELEDVVVRDTLWQRADGSGGRAVSAELGGTLRVTRAILTRNHEVTVALLGPPGTASLTDVAILDTRPRRDTTAGGGLFAEPGWNVTLDRVSIEQALTMGAWFDGAHVTAHDLSVRHVESAADTGLLGYGVQLSHGGTLDGTRVSITMARGVGLLATGAGSRATLADVRVSDVMAQACIVDSCMRASFGGGVLASIGGTVELERFVVSHAEFVGVQLFMGGVVDLHDGEVSNNETGVNVQTMPFDLARLQDRVAYRDNATNYDGAFFPVPGAADVPGF